MKNNDIMKMLQIRNERRKPECQENSMHDLADTIFGVHARLLSTEKNVINPDFHTPFSALHFGAEMLSAEILT